MKPGQTRRNEPQDFLCYLRLAELDKLCPESVGDDLIELAVIDEPAVDKRLLDGFAVELRFLQHVVRLRWLEHVLLDENVRYLLGVHCGTCRFVGRFSETPPHLTASDTDVLQFEIWPLIDIS